MSTTLESLMLDHSSGILLLVDPRTLVIHEVSKPTLRLLGYRREELLGRQITDIECALSDVFFWEEVRQGSLVEAKGVESIYQCANGETLPTIKTISRGNYEGNAWLVICAEPLGSRRRTEDELAFATSRLSATLEATADGILLLDRNGRIVNMNQRFSQVWGLPDELLIQHDDNAIFAFMVKAVADRDAYRAGLESIHPDDDNETYDILRLEDGRIIERKSRPARHGELIFGRVFSFIDVTEIKKAESELRIAATAFESQEAMMITDANQVILKVNHAFTRITGYTSEEAIGQTPAILKSGRNVAQLYKTMWQSLNSENFWQGEIWNRRKNQEEFPGWFTITAVNGPEGQITHYVAAFSDITEHKAAEEQLRKLSLAVEQSPESIVITNLNAEIEYVNAAFLQKTGYSREEAIGKNPRILHSGKTPPETFAALWDALTHGQSWKGELYNQRKDGSGYIEHAVITPIHQADGSITHYVAVKEDITAKKMAEDKINTLAFYDPLTDLPNRRLLLDRLQQAMASSSRTERECALLFIDLDNFKTLNDTLGHDIGDLLLQQVAQRLITCIREGDTVARLGGDEFVVMLEDLSENSPEAAAQAKVVGEKILGVLNQPYQLASYPHHSTPSIGITLFAKHQETIDDLLKQADLAMYQAKAAGRNTLRFFDPEMQAVVTTRAALEADLREAVLKEQFLLYYQAQVVGEGRLTGAEVLLRWKHPERGMVSPAEFIPLAEDTGWILPLGHWVLQTACAQLAKWAAQPEMAHLTVAVNVSARQFRLPNFVEEVLAIIAHHGTDPQRLKLELTESLLVNDVEDIISKMAALKAKGVGFSLDDFGTGYSSLSYLKRLPLDQLKIDQGFVRNILTDTNDAAIAKMVVALAESMGLAVIAEGVEIEAQRDFLAHIGCHAYQGYLFSRPIPLGEFEEYVKRI